MNHPPPPKCFECGSKHAVKNGKKQNGVQNYKCVDCNKQFVATRHTPFYRKGVDAQKTLVLSVLLNIKGAISFRVLEQFVELIFGVKRAHTTYYYRHLSLNHTFDSILKQYKPDFGKIWHIDEIFSKVKGTPGKFGYLFVVTDQHSNIISTYQSDRRDTQSAIRTLKKARDLAEFAPDIIVHDGCPIYDRAVRVFGPKTKHCQAHFKAEPFLLCKGGRRELYYLSNNVVEHVNSFIRVWTHHMRGFKSLEKANIWCQMFQTCYNFLRGARLKELATALVTL